MRFILCTLTLTALLVFLPSALAQGTAQAATSRTCTTVDPVANTWSNTRGARGTYRDMGDRIVYRGSRPTPTVVRLVEHVRGTGVRRSCRG